MNWTAIPMFMEDKASGPGYIDRATALAVKMRHALYYAKYNRAKEAAQAIIDMGKFELEKIMRVCSDWKEKIPRR